MPSFDIVSKPDMPSINNAIDGVTREISTRYDFKGSKSKVEIIEEMIIKNPGQWLWSHNRWKQ